MNKVKSNARSPRPKLVAGFLFFPLRRPALKHRYQSGIIGTPSGFNFPARIDYSGFYYSSTTSITTLMLARAASERLSEELASYFAGLFSPYPIVVILFPLIPPTFTKYSFTASALLSLSFWLYSSEPAAEVYPDI